MKIKENIYSVGILNPGLRIFDIIMKTEFGTSYNSYIVRGDKIALIDISHSNFTKQYLENINKVCNPKDIDYIIVNHCEPDHTGALVDLLKVATRAKIYTTNAGAINLKNITNISNLNLQIVKDNDTLELGQNKTLQFIIAPFLHWPDSMFTYLKQDKMVFSCDFLGTHYCEPYMIDKNVKYVDEYKASVKNYYDGIFGPFAQYVQNGLKKLSVLDIEYVCNSHGPILTKDGLLKYVLDKYNEWSQPIDYEKMIPIFYVSAYGNTAKIAETICKTIKQLKPNTQVKLFDINEHEPAELNTIINQCSTFCIGSPTLNHNAVAPIWSLLNSIDLGLPHKRKALVFGDYGWSGEGTILMTNYLKGIKVKVNDEPIRICFTPTQQDLHNVEDATKKFILEL